MSDRKLRWLGLGLVATAGAGVLGLSAMTNPAFAHADDSPDIGLVIGATERPIPGPEFVAAADELYLGKLYPDLTFYQATPATPENPLGPFGNGLFTPEGAYPLFGGGVQQLYYNYPLDSDGLPSLTTSVGQGAAILESTIQADQAAGDGSTVFGYSQSSTLAGVTMQLLDPHGVNDSETPNAPQFLLIADPNNPNGGLFERFNGFETTSGQTTVDQLNLASLGIAFNGATPSDDYVTNIYTLEYDGFADFPRYPLNFLSDLNAFLGIEDLHGTYLNAAAGETGPTPTDIADAKLLPGSALDGNTDSLTNYYMIDTIDGEPVTPPLVGLLPQPLQDLLGPDLTYLINLGYGDGTLGYSDTPANVPTPFGLFPDVSLSTVLSTLASDTEQGITAFGQELATDPGALFASVDPASSGQSFMDLLSALSADAANPAASLTEFVNGISSAASTAYSTLLPTTDIINSLVTSLPAYDVSLFTDNISNGDILDALGLPLAADTAIGTLAAGFEFSILSDAASQIAGDFSGLF
jgi:hypothetical protein